MDVQVIRGSRAEALLEDVSFHVEWADLCARCPWATAYQGAPYVRTWYASYRDRYEPVLLISRDVATGRLKGLFTLAVSEAEGRLGAAGLWQSEYHTWVCEQRDGNAFACAALRKLRQEFPSLSLHLRYLAPRTPLGWLHGDGTGNDGDSLLSRRCVLRSHRRPVLQFGDGEQARASLKKRANKGRLRRLARLGPVEFRHITSAEEVDRAFDTIARIYDARRLAVNGAAPFQLDPHKRPFHLALMRQPNLMHATLLTAGERVVSAQLNILDRDRQARLNFIAYDPLLSEYSPGKFHILMLARMLFESGYEELDLTPGDEAFKQRFANVWDEVHTLTVLPGATARTRTLVSHRAIDFAKRTLTRLEVRPAQAEATWRQFWETHDGFQKVRLAKHAACGVVRRGVRRVAGRRIVQLYQCDGAVASALASDALVRRDALEDLLAYPDKSLCAGTRQSFLSTAFYRVERGMHVYTSLGRDGRLAHVAWVNECAGGSDDHEQRGTSAGGSNAGGDQDVDLSEPLTPGACHLPPRSALVSSLIVVDDRASSDETEAFVRTLVRTVGRTEDVDRVFVAVPRAKRAFHDAITKMGLMLDRTVVERRTFGMGRRRVVSGRVEPLGVAVEHAPEAATPHPGGGEAGRAVPRGGRSRKSAREHASAGAVEK